jgi:hypothetical protein
MKIDEHTIEIKIPTQRPIITGLLATIGYALLVFNTILPYYGLSMGVINGGVAIGLFIILHITSHAVSNLLNQQYYEMAMDRAALKLLIDKVKETGTFPYEDSLNNSQGEVDED